VLTASLACFKYSEKRQSPIVAQANLGGGAWQNNHNYKTTVNSHGNRLKSVAGDAFYYNMISLSLNTVWQKLPILRRNLGHSRFETARTTDGGAQPPGFTVREIIIRI
jgi:hypothetical protein